MFMSPLGGIMFQIVPMMIFLIFMMVFGIIIFRMVSGAKEWKKNNDSPVLSVSAKVVAKRTDVKYHHHHVNEQVHHSSSTNYYVTFEVESGDRMEMKMKGNQYGMLVEGDRGQLTFQGTRYLDFKRK